MIRRGLFDRLGAFEESWQLTSDIAWYCKVRELWR